MFDWLKDMFGGAVAEQLPDLGGITEQFSGVTEQLGGIGEQAISIAESGAADLAGGLEQNIDSINPLNQ